MYIDQLSLSRFRSWDELQLHLTPGLTVLSGPNGHGKTNVVEAVDYLAHLRSHRVARDGDLVRRGCETARIGATIVNAGRELTAYVLINAKGANRAQLNRTECAPRDILGVLHAVLFSPEDLTLVAGEPAERRRYIDSLMESRYPSWAGMRVDYEKIVRQRNALLKKIGRGGARTFGSRPAGGASAVGSSGSSNVSRETFGGADTIASTLDVWDTQLAHAGAIIIARRIALIGILRPFVVEAYRRLAPSSRPIDMRYISSIEAELRMAGCTAELCMEDPRAATELIEEALAAAIRTGRGVDMERGTTTVGPHRDDIALLLGGQPARGYASHGEQWSMALSLRLASFEWLRSHGSDPVLILDDVFSSLDSSRRAALVSVALDAEQTLVTAAVGDDLPPDLISNSVRVLGVEATIGNVSRETCEGAAVSSAGNSASRDTPENTSSTGTSLNPATGVGIESNDSMPGSADDRGTMWASASTDGPHNSVSVQGSAMSTDPSARGSVDFTPAPAMGSQTTTALDQAFAFLEQSSALCDHNPMVLGDTSTLIDDTPTSAIVRDSLVDAGPIQGGVVDALRIQGDAVGISRNDYPADSSAQAVNAEVSVSDD